MKQPPHQEAALDIITICALGAALSAAQTNGLLALVLAEPHTVMECTRKLQLSERMVVCVLDVLVAAGLIQKSGERYGIAADAPLSMRLVPEWLPGLQAHFGQTSHLLRSGEVLPWMDGSQVQREATYRGVVDSLGKMYGNIAAFLAQQLDIQPKRILDVGCGSGVWSLAIAELYSEAQVTGLDYPTVLSAFESRAVQSNLKERTNRLPGDMFEVSLPDESFDLVIIANVLRLETPLRAAQLIKKVSGTLRHGGHLLIIDALAVGTPAKELARSAYALNLALRTQDGRVHTPAQIKRWMQECGFDEIVEVDCGVQITALGVLIGQKNSVGYER